MSNYNPQLLKTADLWALSLGAVLLTRNGARYETGYDLRQSGYSREEHHLALVRDWGIDSSQSLIQLLEKLLDDGHGESFNERRHYLTTLSSADQLAFLNHLQSDQEEYNRYRLVRDYHHKLPPAGIKAWDWGRYVLLCNNGVFLGYLTQDEAIRLMHSVAIIAQRSYSSWLEFSIGYLAGYQYWLNQLSGDKTEEYAKLALRLLTDKQSPWRILDWNTDLS